MTKKQQLKVIPGSRLTDIDPPATLGEAGTNLWRSILSDFRIDDPVGLELLLQACAAKDRLAECVDRIADDGPVIETRGGPKEHPLLKLEIQLRSFIVRTLQRLGITSEPVKQMGRPPGGGSWRGPMG